MQEAGERVRHSAVDRHDRCVAVRRLNRKFASEAADNVDSLENQEQVAAYLYFLYP